MNEFQIYSKVHIAVSRGSKRSKTQLYDLTRKGKTEAEKILPSKHRFITVLQCFQNNSIIIVYYNSSKIASFSECPQELFTFLDFDEKCPKY